MLKILRWLAILSGRRGFFERLYLSMLARRCLVLLERIAPTLTNS